VFTIPNELDLVIMNPPFTRATGRAESYGEGSESRGLFGFIVNVTQKRATSTKPGITHPALWLFSRHAHQTFAKYL